MAPLKWVDIAEDDPRPSPGTYAVMVKGDHEADGAHVYYSFDDYQTIAEVVDNEDGGKFRGYHDEEDSSVFAYYGPLDIPDYQPKECVIPPRPSTAALKIAFFFVLALAIGTSAKVVMRWLGVL
jgi:hypothetical protein